MVSKIDFAKCFCVVSLWGWLIYSYFVRFPLHFFFAFSKVQHLLWVQNRRSPRGVYCRDFSGMVILFHFVGYFSGHLFLWLSASVTMSSFFVHQTESMLLQQLPGGSCAKSWNCMPGLVCIDDVCSNCETDDQCMMRNTKNRCQNDTHGVPTCAHKPLMKRKCHIDVLVE